MKRFLKILIATLLLGVASSDCPESCVCTNDSVTCVQQDLDVVPNFKTLTMEPVIIDLSGNEIDIIEAMDFSFDNNENIIEIYLNESKIIDIDEEAFVELFSLQELYLAGNILTDVPEGLIRQNDNLIVLDLSRNKFSTMPVLQSKSLEVLALASSGITSVPENALVDLQSLRVLLLQENHLKSLSLAIFKPTSFLQVNLTYNPWACNCDTIKLFDFLKQKNLSSDNELIMCQGSSKTFHNLSETSCAIDLEAQSLSKTDAADALLLENIVQLEENSTQNYLGDTVIIKQMFCLTFADALPYILTSLFIGLPVVFFFGFFLGKYYAAKAYQLNLKSESTKTLLLFR